MLQFACPYCNGMFQVDPSMAGGEAMCPLCHAVVVVPADIGGFAPPAESRPAAPDAFDFTRKRRGGMFEGLDQGPPLPGQLADWKPPQPTHGGALSDAAALVAMGCPYCGSPFQVDPALAGQQAMCPTCQGLVVIPDFSAPEQTYPPQPPGGFPEPPGQPSFGLGPTGFPTPPTSAPAPPLHAPKSYPLQPGFEPTTAAGVPVSPLTPPSATFSPPPLTARSFGPADVPLSTRQSVTDKGSTPNPSQSLSNTAALTPTTSPSPPARSEVAAPLRPVVLPTGEAAVPSTYRPDSPTKSKAGSKRSRAEKIEAMLPDVADPDEEVVAERPIAVGEPPDAELEALVAAVGSESAATDAEGNPIPRRSAEDRARLRRLRTLLLFGVGMLVLILAALLLPRIGFLIDIGKSPR